MKIENENLDEKKSSSHKNRRTQFITRVKMIKKVETSYIKILVTAILTAILTSLSQYFLQENNLSGEQEYWLKRYELEKLDKINSQRLKLVESINSDILQLEIKAKEIKINVAVANYDTSSKKLNELSNLMVQYHKDIYLFAAKTQMASLYFGKEVNSLIPILNKSLELNFKNNLPINKSGIRLSEFELDFKTIDTLTKSRIAILKAMVYEISNSTELKKKIQN